MKGKKHIITNAIKSAGKITITRAVKYIPGVGNTIDGFREFKNLIAETQGELNEIKLQEYLLGINKCPDNIVVTDEDFSHIIRQLAKDDETSKTGFYSKLTISLSNSTMDRDKRAFYINTLGALTRYEVEFAKKYYIYNLYDVSGYSSKKKQIESLLPYGDGLLLRSTNKLLANGLIFINQSKASEDDGYQVTDFLNEFISLIFNEKDISPDNENLNLKKPYDFIIGFDKTMIDLKTFDFKFNNIVIDFCSELEGSFGLEHDKYITINSRDWMSLRTKVKAYFYFRLIFNEDHTKIGLYSLTEESFLDKIEVTNDDERVYIFDKDNKELTNEIIQYINYEILEPVMDKYRNE